MPRTHLQLFRMMKGLKGTKRCGPDSWSRTQWAFSVALLLVLCCVHRQWSDWRSSFLCTFIPLMYRIISIWGIFVLLATNWLLVCLCSDEVTRAPCVTWRVTWSYQSALIFFLINEQSISYFLKLFIIYDQFDNNVSFKIVIAGCCTIKNN